MDISHARNLRGKGCGSSFEVICNAMSRNDDGMKRMPQHKEERTLQDSNWNCLHKLVPNFSHSTGKVRRVQKVGTFLFACVLFALAMDSTQHGVIYGGAPTLEQGRNLNE